MYYPKIEVGSTPLTRTEIEKRQRHEAPERKQFMLIAISLFILIGTFGIRHIMVTEGYRLYSDFNQYIPLITVLGILLQISTIYAKNLYGKYDYISIDNQILINRYSKEPKVLLWVTTILKKEERPLVLVEIKAIAEYLKNKKTKSHVL